LGDCVNFLSGGTPSKKNPEYWDGDIPWVSCKDMKTTYLSDSQDHITEAGAANGTRLVSPGTILIVVRGMILSQHFPVAIAKRKMAFNQDLKALQCAPNVDQKFLFHWLQGKSYEILGIADEAAHGTKRLQTDRLQNFPLHLPPLPLQRKITAILSAYDDLIENNRRRIEILEEMARSLYREWFVNFRFPGHEQVKMVDSELGLIPEGWEVKPLSEVCERINYGYTAKAKAEPIGLNFLRITDIVPHLINWDSVPYCEISDKDIQKFRLEEGDIVIARTGATVGYAKRLNKRHPNSVFASYLVRLRINEQSNSHYIGVIVESDTYKDLIKANMSGVAQPQANAKVLTSFPVILPAKKLQDCFKDIVSDFFDQR
jgi:type I restriction enzyme S subunit